MKTKPVPSALFHVLVLLSILASAGSSYASPERTGILTGTSTDSLGSPLPGASVIVLGTDKGAVCDMQGRYTIPLKAGTYDLKCVMMGFLPALRIGVRVTADSTVRVDFSLKPTRIEGQAVIVCADKPTVRQDATSSLSDVIQMQAGVSNASREYRSKTPSPVRIPVYGGNTLPNDEEYDSMFFRNYGVNPFVDTADDSLSTFSIDVDNASYTLTRNYLERGSLPDKDAVRVEEFVNYFDQAYPTPPKSEPFAVYTEAAPSRFGDGNKVLLKIGVQGRPVDVENRKDAVLTFVIDVSGSMAREDRLELVKKSLHVLLDNLRENDRVGIAVYESSGRKVLDHTSVRDRTRIEEAIDGLRTAGSTFAEEGLRIGYGMASEAFQEGAINRVILCSDGVANVGNTGPESILKIVREHRKRGITLTTIGFGMGNYNDVLMEQLADDGDGNYYYVDAFGEARRIFTTGLTGMLQVIARDVKIQVAFDGAAVERWRLLGYENRDIRDKDFRNDKVDAGEVGAGHTVTALYELKLAGNRPAGPLGTVRLRFKDEKGENVRETAHPILPSDCAGAFDAASARFRAAAAVAEFAEILRGSYWAKESRLEDVLAVAERAKADLAGDEAFADFIGQVKNAIAIKNRGGTEGQEE